MKLNIEPISQRDSKWSAKKLGTSSVSIGDYGCYLTCLSMLLKYYGHEQTPDVLNELFKSNGVYVQKNLVDGWAVSKVYADIKYDEHYECPDVPCDLTKIDKYLDEKKPVIAKVDFSPKEGVQDHFVLIIGKENDDYFINDPWTGETYFFSAKYGEPSRFIYGLRLYSGEVKEVTNNEDKISDLENKVKSLNEENARIRLELNSVRDDLQIQERDNADLVKQLNEARNQRDKAVSQQQVLEGKVKNLEEAIKDKDSKYKTLLEENKALKDSVKTALDDSTTGMLIQELLNRLFKH